MSKFRPISKSFIEKFPITWPYFDEIEMTETLLTEKEEFDLGRKILNGDQNAVMKLTKANLRLVLPMVIKYRNFGLIRFPDLINEGNLGLIQAAKNFDPNKSRFVMQAFSVIRGSIAKAITDHSRSVRIPINQIANVRMFNKTSSRLEQKLYRQPTYTEILQMMTISKKDQEVLFDSLEKDCSFDEPFSLPTDSWNTPKRNLYETTPHPGEAPDEQLTEESLKIEVERIFQTISQKERVVLKLFFGIGIPEALTLEQIGIQMDLTRERVRQIKEKALKKLKKPAVKKHLKIYLG